MGRVGARAGASSTSMTRLGRGGRIVAGAVEGAGVGAGEGVGAGDGVGAGSGVGAGWGVLGTSASASASSVWTVLGGRIVAVEAGDGLRRAWRIPIPILQ
jgi:hypothetical protein